MDVQSKTITMVSIEPGAVVAGRYEVCEKVGTGGMGTVFRVIDRHLNNEIVALKLLHPHLGDDGEVFARFRNEVLVARALSHPNIVRLHDIGKAEEGFHYISMEFVDGYSLKDRIERDPALSLPALSFEDALVTLYDLCSAVAYAHAKGVIHRDLKPANVMMTKHHEVKLSDFGTARIVGLSRNFTQTGAVIGTPDYMSPEQIQGHSLDSKCDIYALGMIAFELATGKKPFSADSSVALAFKHMTEPMPRFAAPENGIPRWYEELVFVATEKDKEKRFGSVVEMARMISECSPGVTGTSTLMMKDGTRSFALGSIQSTTPSAASTSTGRGAFELGNSTTTTTTHRNDEWSVGSAEATATTAPLPVSSAKSNYWLLPVLMLLALLVSIRYIPQLNLVVTGALWSVEERASAENSILAKLLGADFSAFDRSVKLPELPTLEVKRSNGESAVPSQGITDLRAELDKELSAGLDADSGVADIRPAEPPELPEVIPAPLPAPEVSAPTPSSPVAPSLETTTALVAAPPEPAPPESTAPLELPPLAIVALEGKFSLREGEREVTSSSIALDRFAEMEWRARLGGFAESQLEQVKARVSGDIAVVLRNQRQDKELARVGVSSVRSAPSQPGSYDLAGKLRGLVRSVPGAGEYELQLVNKDAVLTAVRLNLYRAEVRAEAKVTNDQKITIVSGATVTGPDSTPDAAVRPGIPKPYAPTTSTLPPAEGARPSVLDKSVSATNTDPSPPEPSAVSGSERFSGNLIMPDSSARAVTLDLNFSGDNVTGTANIKELGSFSVEGKLFPRGFELTLMSSELGLRLSGSKNGGSLRGRFSIPAKQQRGTWEAAKQ